ncbi:MAG: class I SAM-dependent methyltransferase [Euryarchaeota archaeon]|nr:class I SAM-dependent methyltransferase [Euryarchaeota archaeon]MDE1835596.1 class I SAM-dependent methyltransferase [Euryarchaeota archaeon]MDE1878944.1 class I SAM-dependent methyltransferase [Euryarchaeota archaeon]MDE2043782.1 class I SAM-dependent methyltransferase [Thermoplasmata archaeon]
MSPPPPTPPLTRARARALLTSWDRMQTRYIPSREARFTAMFDLLEAGLPSTFRALDVGCGPGSLSFRLLARFPRARVVAVDIDPLLLTIGRTSAPPSVAQRLRWVESDLRSPTWARALPPGRFDAVLSTTALHWFLPPQLRRVYRDLRTLLRPGGVLLNGDKAPLGEESPRLRELASETLHRRQRVLEVRRSALEWREWWREAGRDPSLHEALKRRNALFPEPTHHEVEPSEEEHRRYLRAAGFRESAVLWRELSNVILVARR